MQACQLCGAKSWGPIDDAVWAGLQLADNPAVEGVVRERFRICDHCHSYAREDLIEDVSPLLAHTRFEPPFPLPPPAGIDYDEATRSAQAMLQRMGVMSKEPETRTERLVRSMLGSGWADNHSANALLVYARAIESELDKHTKSGQPAAAGATVAPSPRNFAADFLIPAQAWMKQLGASSRVTDEALPFVLDIAIAFGALESLTGNESLGKSFLSELDRTYWEKVSRLSRWVA